MHVDKNGHNINMNDKVTMYSYIDGKNEGVVTGFFNGKVVVEVTSKDMGECDNEITLIKSICLEVILP